MSSQLEDALRWFRANLAIPDKFNRSKSKGAREKTTSGLSWFKENASEAIRRSYELIGLLQENGYPIEVIRTERVGYIVYEDDQQVVAEPFYDSPVQAPHHKKLGGLEHLGSLAWRCNNSLSAGLSELPAMRVRGVKAAGRRASTGRPPAWRFG